jgi:alkylation response protein AidB-like acyl-CoA dehydrogenase
VDLQLDQTQRSVREALETLLGRHAGPARAREVQAVGGSDRELMERLDEAGFLDLFADPDAGAVTAALVAEWVAEAGGVGPVGWRTLTLPAVVEAELPSVVAVMERDRPGPVRFAGDADALLVIDGREAELLDRGDFSTEPVESIFGYPLATVTPGRGRPLAAGAGSLARRWWRVAIAAEVAGTAAAVVSFMLRFLTEREQFGRPLGSFQALQHRMVECYVLVEGVRWTAREAVYLGAPDEQSAVAATLAVEAASRILQESHQQAGSIGFTLEFDLHIWSLRLQTLRVEAGGLAGHADALVRSRWE